MNIKIKKSLGQRGIAHLAVLMVVVIGAGIAGTYTLVNSKADVPCKRRHVFVYDRCYKYMSRQYFAARVLELEDKGRIRFVDTGFGAIDQRDQTSPRYNIVHAMQKQKAKTTRNCEGRNGVAGTRVTTYLDVKLLRFLRDLGDETTFTITSLAGQCHGSKRSMHYKGKAVDIGCPFSGQQLETARKVGQRYGITNNHETCAEHHHYHFSFGGR